jgi:WD40 repeat protein
MGMPGAARTIALAFAGMMVLCATTAARETPRFVPQLVLTDLQPRKVRSAPDQLALLMVVNASGRIDLFDVSNLGRPVKITEIAAAAQDAALTPKGTARDKIRVVSGGFDGTVRLWTLDGKAAAEPFKGHDGPVISVAFSPDGTRIVSGGFEGTVRLWTLDGKAAAEPFRGHSRGIVSGGVTSVAFSPDGERIVSGGADGVVRLWTINGKTVAEPLKAHDEGVLSVAFSPDGAHFVSGGKDHTVRLWALDGKAAAEPFRGHGGWVTSVAFSPDGTRIVSASIDGTVRLWRLDGRAAAEPFRGHYREVWSVAFSPSGKSIMSGGVDGTVRLWTLKRPVAEPFRGHDGTVTSVAFSPDGTRIVSGGEDGTVRLWPLDGKTRAELFRGHDGGVRSVAFSPDGRRLVSGGSDGTVRLWALDGEAAAELFRGHDGTVTSVAFSPDGTRIVSGGFDGTVRLWTLDGKAAAEPFKGHDGPVISVAFSPDGTRIVSGGDDGTVRLWTLDGKAVAESLKAHNGGVSSVAFSRDGARIVSGGKDDMVRQWTLDGKAAAEPFKGYGGWILGVAFSPDGTRIVSGGEDGTVWLWTLDGKTLAEPFLGHDGPVLSVAFSPGDDGTRIVSGSQDGTVLLWRLVGKPAVEPFKGRGADSELLSVAFSPEGKRIVSIGLHDGAIRLWKLDGEAFAEPFKEHHRKLTSVAFSSDGTRIVSGGLDGTVRLWTLDGKALAEPFKGHDGRVTSVAFSPDGTRIVSGSIDGTVRLWALDGKAAGEPFWGHDGAVLSVAFSHDGKHIVSGGNDHTVRLWALDGKALAEPFKGHDGRVTSVAFSPDGTRIVSGSIDDGTVRRWSVAARTSSILNFCPSPLGMGFLHKDRFWMGCLDRVVVQSGTFRPLGEIFLSNEGLAASVYSEGVYVPSDRMESPFRAITADGSVNWDHSAVPEIPLHRVRQVLFDDWTWTEYIREVANQTYAALETSYQGLGWWKAPFWPALGWLIAIVVAIGMWFFAPHKLATWAMPRVGSAEMPTWKWLAGVLILFGYLGTTRRPLRAWLRRNRDALYEKNFAGRTPVKEREKYCVLTHDVEIAAIAFDLSAAGGARLWITGVGGSGKSALSFQMLRTASDNSASAPLPILVDEDWDGQLLDHVALLLRLDDRVPARKMIEVLGCRGDLCPVIDSLSERGMSDAADRVAAAINSGTFKSIIVTSRQPAPIGKVWQTFRSITALPLTAAQVPDYVAAYAPQDRRAQVLERIKPLITDKRSLSPLFLRFAIEQALAGTATSTSTLDLVLQYVEALRAGKLDLSADDMLRAASIAAREAVRESLVPREIEQSYLRAMLVKEADAIAFMNAKNDESIDPAAIIEMLVDCGLLNRNRTNRRLQFAYDPVAEQLAARVVAQKSKDVSIARLKKRILSEPGSAIARAMGEMELAVGS